MTQHRLLLAVAFGIVFFIGLLVFAPASLMGYALERSSGGILSLAQPMGSIWNGSGVALLHQNQRYQTLGSYQWNVQMFNASLQVKTGEFTPMTVQYVPFTGRVFISNLHLALPASTLELVAPQLGPYQLQGMFDTSSDHLILDATGMNGLINVNWVHAASGLSEIRPLGDYRILLTGSGTALDAELSTLSGKLLLSGTGRYDKVTGLSISATAQASPGAAMNELNELLHHIGPEVRPGVFTVAIMPQPTSR